MIPLVRGFEEPHRTFVFGQAEAVEADPTMDLPSDVREMAAVTYRCGCEGVIFGPYGQRWRHADMQHAIRKAALTRCPCCRAGQEGRS